MTAITAKLLTVRSGRLLYTHSAQKVARALHRISLPVALLTSALALSACSGAYKKQAHELVQLPDAWQTDATEPAVVKAPAAAKPDVPLSWSQLVESSALNAVIGHALSLNQGLAQAALDVEIAKTLLFQSKMAFLPQLDISLGASESRNANQNNQNNANTNNTNRQFSTSANLVYNVNLLGQLGDAKSSAYYSYATAKANYEQTLRDLMTQVASAWANVIEAQQLSQMRSTRLETLQQNLSIIENGYRRGLNQALEVYLARNDVENETAQLTLAQQNLSDTRRSLMVLLGAYPDDSQVSPDEFPTVYTVAPPALPSDILMKRPDLQAAWLGVLTQNANVAIAHKARFPSLRLTSSAGYQSDELGALMDEPLQWSFGASILQPIFQAGSLKAAEIQQKAQLKQAELRYTAAVYSAFQDVESRLQQQHTLQQRLTATTHSRDNALIAEKLSFEQYGKGLQSYTTVLDAQRRAVDAEIQLIALKKQLFINTIALHQSLAGELDINHPALTAIKES